MNRSDLLDRIDVGQGPTRPDPPEAGRGSPRTKEEIIEFMSECTQDKWALEAGTGVRQYFSGKASDKIQPENKMRAAEVFCAGVIAKPITVNQTRRDILHVWKQSDERERIIEEGL